MIVVLGHTYIEGDEWNGGLKRSGYKDWHKTFSNKNQLNEWLKTKPSGTFNAYYVGEKIEIKKIMKPQPDLHVGYEITE